MYQVLPHSNKKRFKVVEVATGKIIGKGMQEVHAHAYAKCKIGIQKLKDEGKVK